MKVGWETKPLSEVCTFKPPKSEARAKLTSVDEVSFVPMEHLGIGNKELKISGTRLLSEVAGSYTYFAEGDVLLAKITPCFENGKLGIARNLVNGVGFGSSEYIVIRPSPEVDADFLYHFLDRATFREEGAKQMTGAVGHKRVPKEYVEGALIPVPTMEEQRRIVTLLDEAFADIATAKAKAEKNLQNARDFFYGQLQAIFQSGSNSWSSSTLGQTYDVRDGTHDSPKYQAEGYPLITSKNLKREGLSFDDVKLIAELDYAKINERSAVHQGDVLLAMIGTIGNPTVVEIEPNFAIKNVALLKVPKTQNSYFLQYYLSTPSVIAKMQSEAKGTTQKFVGLGYLRTFPVSIPTLTEQQKIVEKLDELRTESDRLESIYRQKLTALDDLKKSLLHQAFSGQL